MRLSNIINIPDIIDKAYSFEIVNCEKYTKIGQMCGRENKLMSFNKKIQAFLGSLKNIKLKEFYIKY